MRIRKRKVPLPLSLLSPIPISSDPHLFTRSPVTLLQPAAQPSHNLPSSHLSRLIDDRDSTSDRLLLLHDDCVVITGSDPVLTKRVPHELVGCCSEVEGVEGMPKSNDDSNKSITTLGATTTTQEVCSNINNGPSLLPNHDEDRTRRSDEDKSVPLKKRSKFVIDEEEKSLNIEDNSKSNNNNNNTKNNIINNDASVINAKKGGKRGNTIMEGSRCSRVNGRGWRCCQPTLVGYSLCEHHLGKGRLRSVSSVRGRPSKKVVLGTSLREDCSPLMQLCEAVKQESEVRVGKRVNKLGVVKARSLSSLLGQTTNTTSSTTSRKGGLRSGVAPSVID
ncbi:hypothetical protein vseg_008164 [Gypsophila vaccaria]